MNINSVLIFGKVKKYVDEKTEKKQTDYDYQSLSLRIYAKEGNGFFFIAGHNPGRWYYDAEPDDGNYGNTSMEEVQKAMESGEIQIVGKRGISYGHWHNWKDFEEEVLK